MTDQEIQMRDIMSHLKGLQNEHAKLKLLAGNYKKYSDTLKQFAQTMIEMAREMDPYLDVSTRKNTDFDYKTMIHDLYDKMKSGTQIGAHFIMVTYGCEHKHAMYIMQALKKMPSVQKRKEGTTAFLYI